MMGRTCPSESRVPQEYELAPSLTPSQLQEARRASGRLGGRPKLPTRAEARQAVLDELVGPALQSLKAHLGTGNADAWRSALKILELQFGRVADPIEVDVDVDPFQVAAMSPAERSQLVRRVLKAYPHLAPLAPAHLFADAVEPEAGDQAGWVGVGAETRRA
jgi:hypothetical protein